MTLSDVSLTRGKSGLRLVVVHPDPDLFLVEPDLEPSDNAVSSSSITLNKEGMSCTSEKLPGDGPCAETEAVAGAKGNWWSVRTKFRHVPLSGSTPSHIRVLELGSGVSSIPILARSPSDDELHSTPPIMMCHWISRCVRKLGSTPRQRDRHFQ